MSAWFCSPHYSSTRREWRSSAGSAGRDRLFVLCCAVTSEASSCSRAPDCGSLMASGGRWRGAGASALRAIFMLDHSRIIRPGLLLRGPSSSNVRAVERRCGSTWQNLTGKARLTSVVAGSAIHAVRAYSSIGQSPRLITGLFLVRTQVGPLCHLVVGHLVVGHLVVGAPTHDSCLLSAGAPTHDSCLLSAGAPTRARLLRAGAPTRGHGDSSGARFLSAPRARSVGVAGQRLDSEESRFQ
jgi:hypothetical protein